jgi:hypothetical protein
VQPVFKPVLRVVFRLRVRLLREEVRDVVQAAEL